MFDAAAPDPADLFEAAPDPTILFGADGAPLRANAAFRRAFRHRISAERPPWGRIDPPGFVADERRFEAAAPDGRRYEWAERRFPDGRRLAVARDVTDRANAAADAARAKTTLFATLTHELRTPLNGILGMAGLLAQSSLDPAQAQYVDAVRRSGEHLLDLITEILDYSRLEAGRLALERAPFSPEDVAQSVVELLSPKAHAKGLDIVAVARAGAPSRVIGDEGRVRQILFNLAGNAVKFTETGGVIIEISASPPAQDGDVTLRFCVRDTGPGVPPEKQAAIFEEFEQADASHARRYGGAGLGLAIVKRLAGAMAGRVGLESRPGAGALFWAELPFGSAPAQPDASSPPRLDGLRFAVSANAQVARGVRMMVESLGGQVVYGPGAAERLAAVLVDHGEAQGDLTAFRAGGAPVVVLVTPEERGALLGYKAAGAAGYLVKPLRRASVGERLRRIAAGFDAQPPEPRATRVAPMSVLLAEDNPVNALLARTVLTRSGCRVQVAIDGQQALEVAMRERFDVILLDLRMPILDGLAVARRIRAGDGPCARAPIVALTADAGEEERAAAFAAGMDAFLTKPLEPQALASTLEALTQTPAEG